MTIDKKAEELLKALRNIPYYKEPYMYEKQLEVVVSVLRQERESAARGAFVAVSANPAITAVEIYDLLSDSPAKEDVK